jgi:hypothetical protein
VIDEDALLVYTPWTGEDAELFEVSPGQPLTEDAEKAVRMRAALDAWDAAAPQAGSRKMDAETEEALRQLGYLE